LPKLLNYTVNKMPDAQAITRRIFLDVDANEAMPQTATETPDCDVEGSSLSFKSIPVTELEPGGTFTENIEI